MPRDPVYLDYAATSPVRPQVLEAMLPFLGATSFGNPSSSHRFGRAARAGLEQGLLPHSRSNGRWGSRWPPQPVDIDEADQVIAAFDRQLVAEFGEAGRREEPHRSDRATARRWLDAGLDVAEIDHGWCTSIYAIDPNGTLVEFCATTKAFTDADREDAQRMLTEANPPLNEAPAPTFHQAQKTVATT